jgi:hypothetical protein
MGESWRERKIRVPTSEQEALPWWKAIFNALAERSIEFYPQLVRNGIPTSLTSGQVLGEAALAAAEWPDDLGNAAKEDIEAAAERAQESLDEVKGLTEYQDQKAFRLLTVTTFLSALGGVLFGRFADAYPLRPLLDSPDDRLILLIPAYAAFALFALSAVCGALVTFHATRTRFKYPEINSPEKQEQDSKSLLFYEPIIRVSPGAWSKGFVQSKGSPNPGLRKDLTRRYLANCIAEAYLIAAKAADKLRYLHAAQLLLSFGNKCLLAFLILAGASSFMKSTKPETGPQAVTLQPLSAPVPVAVHSLPSPTVSPAPPAPATSPEPAGRVSKAEQGKGPDGR